MSNSENREGRKEGDMHRIENTPFCHERNNATDSEIVRLGKV